MFRAGPAISIVIVFLILSFATSEGWAQICMGLPAGEGQISIQAERSTGGGPDAFGGRLGLNFNTEFAFGFNLHRPEHDEGRGLIIGGTLGFEMDEYRPPICFVIGVEHERTPLGQGEEARGTLVPIGLGIGKRLGDAKGISLALFLLPEYLYQLKPDPGGEEEGFWAELGARSHGRGSIGLVLATPFIFASGRVELSTLNDYRPTVAIGLGLTF